MPVPGGQLERGLTNLSIRLVQTLAKQQRQYEELGFREVQQQFQVDVTGKATATAKWDFKDLTFAYPFSYAPTRRDSDLVLPHFTYGEYMPLEDPDTGLPLSERFTPKAVMTAKVSHYFRDPNNDTFTAARIWLGAYVPGADPANLSNYAASMHLTFQGYAAPDQDETDL